MNTLLALAFIFFSSLLGGPIGFFGSLIVVGIWAKAA